MSNVVGFSTAGLAASTASTSRANVRACASTSNSSTYSQPAWRTLRMSLRVAEGRLEQRPPGRLSRDPIGSREAPRAVVEHPDADAAIAVALGALDLAILHRHGLALAFDVARVGVARAALCRPLDGVLE